MCSAWGDGEVVLTERGLFVCDPARSEFVSVGWRNFDRSQLILGVADEPASLTMTMAGRGPILFQMEPELAATILGISGRFWYSQPDDGTARAKGAVPPNTIFTSQMLSSAPPPSAPPNRQGHSATHPVSSKADSTTTGMWDRHPAIPSGPEIPAVPLTMLPDIHTSQHSNSAAEFPRATNDRRRIAIWAAGSLAAAATMIVGFGIAGNQKPAAVGGQVEGPRINVLDIHESDPAADTQTTMAQQSSRRTGQPETSTTPIASVEPAPAEEPSVTEDTPKSLVETTVTTLTDPTVTALAEASSTTAPVEPSVASEQTTMADSVASTATLSIGGPTTHPIADQSMPTVGMGSTVQTQPGMMESTPS